MALLRRLASCRPGLGSLRRRVLLALSALLLALGPAARADSPISAANQLKAVFLFNFAQFVAWPSAAFSEPKSPIVLGVLGDNPFGSYLEALVKGEMINGRPIVVQRYRRLEEVQTCHILFISRSEYAELDRILPKLRGRPILTVGEEEAFTKRGGMVGLVGQPNGKIGLWIDNAAAKEATLTISSRLLAHATLVTEERN